jgi:multiple sugar transport system permease protein
LPPPRLTLAPGLRRSGPRTDGKKQPAVQVSMTAHAEVSVGLHFSPREASRARAISRFRWTILGPLIALFALVLLPVLFLQLYFSFHQWSVYLGSWWEADYVGVELFREVLTDDRFGWAIVRSLMFSAASTVGCFLLGFALAYLMHKPFAGQSFFYVIFILPMLTVPIVVAYTAEMLLYQSGPVNDIISRLSGTQFKVAWLTDADIALAAVTLLEIWNWTPFSFIIMLAGLSSIPREPIEAAQILGASRWRVFIEVQLPLLRPVIFLALVLRFLEAMAEFPKTWALFQGGPGTATETIPVYIFLTTWQYFQVSKGAALSYAAMMLMIVIVLLAIRLLRREKRALDIMYAAPEGTR